MKSPFTSSHFKNQHSPIATLKSYTAHGDNLLKQIHILRAQSNQLHQPQSRPKHQSRHQVPVGFNALIAISPNVPDTLVSSLIVGASWRERLLGLSLAMTKDTTAFVDRILTSLRDVRGISIVPACAALAVLACRGLFDASRLLTGEFDRTAFDGELGWALDIAARYAAGQSVSPNVRGPNYGQFFAHQIELYEHILNGQDVDPNA